jgi:hypothetical protein
LDKGVWTLIFTIWSDPNSASVNIPIQEVGFNVLNGQSTPLAFGLALPNNLIGFTEIVYWAKRVTTGIGATELTEGGMLQVTTDIGSKNIRLVQMPIGPDYSGLEFSVSPSTGQIMYTSTNLTGTPSVSRMKFKIPTIWNLYQTISTSWAPWWGQAISTTWTPWWGQ